MPVFGNQKQITPTEGREPGRKGGSRTQSLLTTEAGVPRFDNLVSTRILGTTDVASLPKNVVKDHVTSTEWVVRPSIENPTTAHEMAADDVTEFLDGNFNKNNDEFDHLLTRYVDDLIDIDTGVLQKVPTENPVFEDGTHALAELYPEDGTVWTKNLTTSGVIPEAPEPAYYQYGMRPQLSTDRGITFDTLNNKFDSFQYVARSAMNTKPIPYSRDEIVWTERNPRPETLSPGRYGFGLTQQAERWVEILLNQNVSNVRQFTDDEHAKGILNLVEGNSSQIQQTRDYIRDQLKGQTDHKLPVVGGQEIEYISMQESLKELQFLESQQWYSQLVWMLYGLNESEVGFDVGSKAIAEEHRRQVFLNTTKPILETIQSEFNRFVLPDMEAYQRVNGELEFAFIFEDPDLERLQREKQQEDLQAGLATPNDVLRERGDEEKPWGDMPQEAVTQLARQHPEWVAENWGGLEEVPKPQAETGFFSYGESKGHGYSKSVTKDADFNADIFRIVAGDDNEMFDEGTVLALGVDFPNSDVYVDWKIDEWPDESQLSGPHVSIYSTIEDAQKVAQGEIEMLESISTDAAKTIATEIKDKSNTRRDTDFRSVHLAKAYGVTKDDALRNENWTGEFPPVKGISDTLERTISRHLQNALDDVESDVKEKWPHVSQDEKNSHVEQAKGLVINPRDLVASLLIKDVLQEAVIESNKQAMQTAADFDAEKLEAEIKDRSDYDDEIAEVGLDFDLEDTFAMEAMEMRAARNMTGVEEAVKQQVATVLQEAADRDSPVNEATSMLRERVGEISDNHARLVARTETLQASREGEQALQESVDIVAGKEWRASSDSRVRPWHESMDGEIVPKNESFTVPSGWQGPPDYQPSGYPRTVRVVGEDSPFNCRCSQDPVLDEDMPEDLRQLRDMSGVDVELKITDAQYNQYRKNVKAGESCKEMIERIESSTDSRSEAVEDYFGNNKRVYYEMLEMYGLK